ncbi:hypothetical protein J5N97_029213 [Dioscorea zingiberensis]|uniref:DUF7725 domain-containing protein n=1 Tax=Dioscorea zingiberensis TaxID=325984 RepID=A0A9D5C0D4_9LILI|nr:hypothetical protein J5N97_029213 [Dioscorea zingiberensis]
MDAAAGRGGSLPVASSSSQPPRKEWRAASDHSFRSGNEESEHVKMGQSDERTIFEVQEAVGSLDVDFCSITIDSGDDDLLRQRLLSIARQREELQQMEVELRAQMIVKSEILDMQKSYEVQLKEHVNAAAKIKEQLQERDEHIRELELKMEEKDRELHAVNSEAAWAKEDFLREQSEKLANFRREHDNSEIEKAQHLKQIHDLQEHFKEKESQFLALEEQHRAAQEAILYKDEQLREAQAWITRLQEMGALQSSSLQAELREHIDQFHQYYISLQRQFMDMERHHLQAIQQLQLELAEAKERNGVTSDGLHSVSSSMDSSFYVQSQGNQKAQDNGSNDTGTLDGNSKFISNGKLDSTPSSISSPNTLTKAEFVPGIPVAPSSIISMSGFLPPGQVNPLPPFVMHPQSVPQPASSTNSSLPLINMDTFQPNAPQQQWQNQQAVPDALQIPNQNEHQTSQENQNLLEPGTHYSYELPVERVEVHEDHRNAHIDRQKMSDAITNGLSEDVQVLEPDGKQFQVSQGSQDTLNINSQFHSTFVFGPSEQQTEPKYENKTPSIKQPQEQGFNSSQQQQVSSVAESAAPNSSITSNNSTDCNGNPMISSESPVLISHSITSVRAKEPSLLDERSLLACIVRAIPAGSGNGIKISTTLPNRLGKMLSPLHWHDYKKQYGKLDDFVAHHPELFIIEGDFIHLREGAQTIISATTAVAKVAAATASSAPSQFPSVAVTPVAQSSRLKRAPLPDLKPLSTLQTTEGSVVTSLGNSGISDGKASTKTKVPQGEGLRELGQYPGDRMGCKQPLSH